MYTCAYLGLNLMKRLLEKDPAKRISATEALNHDFFSKDEMFKEFTEYRKSHLSEECNSPLMMTKNRERKNKGLVRDDSCLKFKMKENIMTGRTDESGETIEEIDSPAAIKQKVVKVNESRFKRLNHHE
jgi:serine/threonine protein kinase